MLLIRVVVGVIGGVLLLALVAVALLRVLKHPRGRGVSLVLALAFPVLAGLGGHGAWSWATAPGIPGVLHYQGHQWFLGQGGQSGIYGTGVPRVCLSEDRLKQLGSWPLHQVGYVTWIGFGSVDGSVGRFPHGYPVYLEANPNAIWLQLRHGCYYGGVMG